MATLEEHEFTFGTKQKTFYLAAGPNNGPLLIFVHGWPGIAKTWKPQLETFASLGFRAIAPDMPGTFELHQALVCLVVAEQLSRKDSFQYRKDTIQ